MSEVSEESIKEVLKGVIDPTYNKNLVELDHIKEASISDNSLHLKIVMNTYQSFQSEIKQAIQEKLSQFKFKDISIEFQVEITKTTPKSDFGPPGMKAQDMMPKVKQIIGVASNKGGVGKSTVSANIACALKQLGATVAILDLDLYGPNIPNMFGVSTQRARYEQKGINPEDGLIQVIEKYDMPLMSVGFILPTDDTAVVIRAPLANQLINEFMTEVDWPEVDYLVVDLPPGTGDIQLTMAQQLPNANIVFVTTPQTVALADVYKGIKMFQEPELNIPVIGIIENMSYFIGDDGKKYEIFGQGGGKKASEDFNINFFGQIPLVQKIREQGDSGTPIVLEHPDHPVSKEYISITEKIALEVARKTFEINSKRPKDFVFEPIDLM